MEQNQNESILSQDEADRLIAIGKIIIGPESFKMPTFGDEKKIISLEDTQAVTSFRVDIQFSRRSNSLKGNYQLRVHSNVPLLRLDFNGPSHSNPDGSKVGGNHLHIYKEGEEDRWAYEPPRKSFSEFNNAARILQEFLKYCNVLNIPTIR